jgi:cytochrome c
MDSYELNKIAGAFLFALLTATVIGYAGNALVSPAKLEKNAFAIEVAEVAAAPVAAPLVAKPDPVSPLLASASVDSGRTVAQRQCASCHSFDKGGRNAVGPNLWNVIGAAKGRVEGFRYSQAMQASGKQAGDDGKWTFENVNAFLLNPKAYMNGTLMAYAGLRSAQDRANLIAYLRGQADSPVPIP